MSFLPNENFKQELDTDLETEETQHQRVVGLDCTKVLLFNPKALSKEESLELNSHLKSLT